MRGLFGSIAAASPAALKSTTAANPASWLVDWVRGGSRTASGVNVGPDTAMRIAACWACIRVRSEDMGKLPFILYRRTGSDGRDRMRAVDHPLYDLVGARPNPWMTSMEWRRLQQSLVDLRGNAYDWKEFDGRGRVVALWPLNPAKVKPLKSDDGELFYELQGGPAAESAFRQPPKTIRVPASEIVHYRGPSLDGLFGLSPIAYHRETIGLALAAQTYGAAFFGNYARPDGAVKVPGPLSADAKQLLRADWKRRFGRGPERSDELAIFDHGMEWVQTGMDNTDAQYIELRKFQVEEIARLYRVPLHKIGSLDKATFSNIEHQALEYVTDCLLSEAKRVETTLALALLTDAERRDLFFENLFDALLRGDTASRHQAYALARQWGWLSVNDIRRLENMNSIGEQGDIYLTPLNMGDAAAPPQAEPKPTPKNLKSFAALARWLAAIEEHGKIEAPAAGSSPGAPARRARRSSGAAAHKGNGHA